MARKISDVINQILTLLPNPAPPEVGDNITVLTAELRILLRVSSYTPPEAADSPVLWERLSAQLYRLLPNPKGYTWAQAVSDLVTAGPGASGLGIQGTAVTINALDATSLTKAFGDKK